MPIFLIGEGGPRRVGGCMVRAMTTKSRFSRLFTCAAVVAAALIAIPGGAISIDAARADILSNTCRQWYPGAQVSNMIPCQSDDRNVDFCTVYPWPSVIGDRFGEAMANLDAQRCSTTPI